MICKSKQNTRKKQLNHGLSLRNKYLRVSLLRKSMTRYYDSLHLCDIQTIRNFGMQCWSRPESKDY